jgi:two-component system, NarL family, response regulator NreC
MTKVSILLADDHKIVCEGLRMLVNAQADMVVVGETDNGRMSLTLARQLQPDIVIMDISMPEVNGLKATEELQRRFPAIKILALTRQRRWLFATDIEGWRERLHTETKRV